MEAGPGMEERRGVAVCRLAELPGGAMADSSLRDFLKRVNGNESWRLGSDMGG